MVCPKPRYLRSRKGKRRLCIKRRRVKNRKRSVSRKRVVKRQRSRSVKRVRRRSVKRVRRRSVRRKSVVTCRKYSRNPLGKRTCVKKGRTRRRVTNRRYVKSKKVCRKYLVSPFGRICIKPGRTRKFKRRRTKR